MKVKEIMTANPECCIADNSAFSAAIHMDKFGFGCMPVVVGQITRRVVGMVTERDLCKAVVARNLLPTSLSVGQAMSSPAITCGPESSVQDCVALMEAHNVRRIPVVDQNGACIGLVSRTDVAAKCAAGTLKATAAA